MNQLLLVDTSVWVDVLKGKSPATYTEVIASGEVVTCLPIIQEVLQGIDAKSTAEFIATRAALGDFRVLEDPLQRSVIDDAIALYRKCRAAGSMVRSSVDCLIAACAIRNDAIVVHRDRDFDSLARVSALRVIHTDK